MNAKILRLNKAGVPVSWLTREETATLLVKDQVIWSLGETVFEMRGGHNRCGIQSVLKLPSIVACDGKVHDEFADPPLENKFPLPAATAIFVSTAEKPFLIRSCPATTCIRFLKAGAISGPTS